MNPAELLDAAKARLELKSDYALSKLSGIPKQRISEIRKGVEAMPLHLIYWIAITLEKDPAELIADLEMQREKNPERLKFWNSFLSRAACWLGTAAVLSLTLSGVPENARAGTGGVRADAHNLRFRQKFAPV